MPRATRAKPAPKETSPEPSPSTTTPLPPATANPPKLFVLPKDASANARIVTLDNPATATPSRYFFCPEKGFYEFTRIAAPKKACRSWLITQDTSETNEEKTTETDGLGTGYVTTNAALFLATPLDALFLLLPALAPTPTTHKPHLFRELDDYTDTLCATSPYWRTLLAQHPSLTTLLERKMRLICDTDAAGNTTVYRLSRAKLHTVLARKAERMVAAGLPPSMEDRFIKTALHIPILSIQNDSTDTDTPTLTTPENIPHLLRLRTALTYLTSTYLPPTLTPSLTPLPPDFPIDFTPLTTHLAALTAHRAAAAAQRSIADNISRKRAVCEDDERVAEREEKKRKKEEEEKRKKSASRGVKGLGKVDVSGMRKMGSFFSVKPKPKT